MDHTRLFVLLLVISVLPWPAGAADEGTETPPSIERVPTLTPFPRGLVMLDGELHVLCRGRVRDSGGVTAAVNDQAGALYAVNPNVAEPTDRPEAGEAVRTNGRLVALPTEPPFRLWNRAADPRHG